MNFLSEISIAKDSTDVLPSDFRGIKGFPHLRICKFSIYCKTCMLSFRFKLTDDTMDQARKYANNHTHYPLPGDTITGDLV